MPKFQCKQTLIEFGYTIKQINCLFEAEPTIRNIEDALLKLEKSPMGYNHKFMGNEFDDNCLICNDLMAIHIEYNFVRLEEGENYDLIVNRVTTKKVKQYDSSSDSQSSNINDSYY